MGKIGQLLPVTVLPMTLVTAKEKRMALELGRANILNLM